MDLSAFEIPGMLLPGVWASRQLKFIVLAPLRPSESGHGLDRRVTQRRKIGPYAQICLRLSDEIHQLETTQREAREASARLYKASMRDFFLNATIADAEKRKEWKQREMNLDLEVNVCALWVVAREVLLQKMQKLELLYSGTILNEDAINKISEFAFGDRPAQLWAHLGASDREENRRFTTQVAV